MSQILGTLLDSAGNPLTGKLRVSLTGTLVNDIDNPDSIFLSKPYLFTITSGVLDIDLQESETSKVTYRFEFFKTDGEGDLIEPALLDFYALVPNVSPVQFATLLPTGMVNDVLDTGALRVARIIASNPNLASNIGGPFPKGNWSPGTTYNYRDLVSYLSRVYISKSISPITGVLPTDTNKWMLLPIEPNGDLLLGDDAPYGVSWNGSGLATSQNTVYDAIQTINTSINAKANIDSPIFTGNPTVPTQAVTNNSSRVANTSWVVSYLNQELNWQTPSLQNSFMDVGGIYTPAGYRKESFNSVVVRGLIKRSTIPTVGTVIFTLPIGFRPTYNHIFLRFISTNTSQRGVAVIEVDSAGLVVFQGYAVTPSSGTVIDYLSIEMEFSTN